MSLKEATKLGWFPEIGTPLAQDFLNLAHIYTWSDQANWAACKLPPSFFNFQVKQYASSSTATKWVATVIESTSYCWQVGKWWEIDDNKVNPFQNQYF